MEIVYHFRIKLGANKIKLLKYIRPLALPIFIFLITNSCNLTVKKPNVILIVCDQLNPRAMGWMGDSLVVTPNLDQFSNNAYCFTNAYCTSPLKDPARHSLFTGVYPSQHWVLKNGMKLKEDLPSILSMLNEHSYKTANIGESQLASFLKPENSQAALDQDFFDVYHGFSLYTSNLQSELGKRNLDYKEYEYLFKGKNGIQEGVDLAYVNPLPEELTLWHWTTKKALKYIDMQREGQSDNPFFLNVSYSSPQKSYAPVKKYADMYLAKLEQLKLPPNFSIDELQKWCEANQDISESLSVEDVKYLRAMYFALVTQLDAALGELFRGINERGLMENTIVVFTANHGDNLGEHGLFYEGNMLEASVGVPLIIQFPEMNLTERRIIEENVSHVDLVTTLLKAAGIAPSNSMPGKDLRPLIEEKEDWTNHAVYAEFYKYHETPSQLMMRKGDYKLTYSVETKNDMFDIRLYNLKQDPWEQQDLSDSADHGGLYVDMSDALMNDYWKKIWITLPREGLN